MYTNILWKDEILRADLMAFSYRMTQELSGCGGHLSIYCGLWGVFSWNYVLLPFIWKFICADLHPHDLTIYSLSAKKENPSLQMGGETSQEGFGHLHLIIQIPPAMQKKRTSSIRMRFFLSGGAGGIWTLGTLLGYTRFPVVPVMTTSILLHVCGSRADLPIIHHRPLFVKPYFYKFCRKFLGLQAGDFYTGFGPVTAFRSPTAIKKWHHPTKVVSLFMAES